MASAGTGSAWGGLALACWELPPVGGRSILVGARMMRDKVISMQMVPVYFQTSRWLRGYLDPPGYESGYKPQRAVTYADQLLAALQNPVPPAVRNFGVSNAPS